MNQPLPPELRELEQMLSSLVPRTLSGDTAELLAASVDAGVCPGNADGLGELEKHLGEISPATMRTDVLSRMVRAMDSWHEHVPVEEKVVSFGTRNDGAKGSGKQPGGMLAAAAAVALLGAVTALVLPRATPEDAGDPAVASHPVDAAGSDYDVSGQTGHKQAWLVPDALSHRVVNTADAGIVMAGNQTPHRCIRLDGMETIKMLDEDGREIVIDRPSVSFVLIPVETN